MKPNKLIRLLIVDDHFIFRLGLIQSIQAERDLVVVGEAAAFDQALDMYRRLRPDVVIVDLRLPGKDGIATTAALREEFPEAAVMVLSAYEGNEDIYRAMRAGARAYLTKSVAREELIRAIRTVYSGQPYLPTEVAVRLAQRPTGSDLSSREMQILDLIVKGARNKEIGAALSIAEVTVKVHVRHLLRKLKVSDRTQATTIAIRRGIVHLE